MKNTKNKQYDALRNILTEESKIPMKVCYGSNDGDKTIAYMKSLLRDKTVTKTVYGKYPTEHIKINKNLEFVKIGSKKDKNKWVTHTWSAQRTFDMDENNDGKSDMLQWLYG